jgi:rRNA maturation RNase YbeY
MNNDFNKILINNFHKLHKPSISNATIRKIIFGVLHNENCRLDFLFINFVSDKDIRKINKKYLKHDYPTDIIVFPYNSTPESLEAEFIISLDRVRANALRYRCSLRNELARVIVHGCLHLSGYNDKSSRQKELIRSMENFYLSNIPELHKF